MVAPDPASKNGRTAGMIHGRAALLERVQAMPKPALMSWLGVAGLTALMLLLGLHDIKARSYWYDEAMSLHFASQPWPDFVDTLLGGELNGAAYYLLLRAWRLLGDGEARIRFLSVLFMAGTIPLLYLVGRTYLGARAAVIGCAVFAANAFVIEYAQEARMYAMTVWISTATVLAWSRAVETGRARWWAAFSVAMGTALYVHFFTAFLLAALTGLLIVGRAPRSRGAILATGAVIAGAVPLALWLLTPRGNLDWVNPTTFDRAAGTLNSLTGGEVTLSLAVYGAALLAMLWQSRTTLWRILPLALWLIVPVAAGLALSVWKPLLIPRYFIVAVPPLALLAGAGLAGLAVSVRRGRRLSLAVPAVALILALSIAPMGAYYERPNNVDPVAINEKLADWRGAADWVARTAEPGDRIMFDLPRGRYPFGLYLRRFGADLEEIPSRTAESGAARTWLVLFRVGHVRHKQIRAQLSAYAVAESKLFRGGVRVQLLVPAAGAAP
jgi:mannosyltransferase